MTRYFRITAMTPYCGETNDYYISLPLGLEEEPYLNDNFWKLIDECIYENAMEWYDEFMCEETFEEYLEGCDYKYKEISQAEFEDESKGA